MSKNPQVKALFAGFGGNTKAGRAAARKALAADAGVSAATVSRWISGESMPDREYWPAIAKAIGRAIEDDLTPTMKPLSLDVEAELVAAQGAVSAAAGDQFALMAAVIRDLHRRVEELEAHTPGFAVRPREVEQ